MRGPFDVVDRHAEDQRAAIIAKACVRWRWRRRCCCCCCSASARRSRRCCRERSTSRRSPTRFPARSPRCGRTAARASRTSRSFSPSPPICRAAQAAGTLYEFAKALNTRLSGARSQVLRAARYAGTGPGAEQGGDDQGRAAAGRRAMLDGDPERLAPIHVILSAQRLRSALDRSGRRSAPCPPIRRSSSASSAARF